MNHYLNNNKCTLLCHLGMRMDQGEELLTVYKYKCIDDKIESLQGQTETFKLVTKMMIFYIRLTFQLLFQS